jgi:hypothetical protein
MYFSNREIGDGVADDTDAINKAISSGGRCGGGKCTGSTIYPATVYFPPGTYKVSSSIIQYYNTEMIGNVSYILGSFATDLSHKYSHLTFQPSSRHQVSSVLVLSLPT